MNITSAKYFAYDGKNSSICVVVDGVQMSVPLDPDNRHYAEIMRQIDAGELTIKDAD